MRLMYVVANILNVRSEPDVTASIVGQAYFGEQVLVLDTFEQWSNIGINRWVSSQWLSEQKPARITHKQKQLIVTLSRVLGISPAVAAATLDAESGLQFFTKRGLPLIRVELHRFRHFLKNDEVFNTYFRHSSVKPWEEHQWRREPSSPWRNFHGSQDSEREVFEFAKQINENAAYRSTSVGASQIMGDNFKIVGYRSPQDMFEDFSSSEEAQIVGFFSYVNNTSCIASLRRGDYFSFAACYNGPGQAEKYKNIIQSKIKQYEGEF